MALEPVPDYAAELIVFNFQEAPLVGWASIKATLVQANGNLITNGDWDAWSPVLMGPALDACVAITTQCRYYDWNDTTQVLRYDLCHRIVDNIVAQPTVAYPWMFANLMCKSTQPLTQEVLLDLMQAELTALFLPEPVELFGRMQRHAGIVDLVIGRLQHFFVLTPANAGLM